MRILDTTKNVIANNTLASGVIIATALFFAGLPILGITVGIMIGSGSTIPVANYLKKKLVNLLWRKEPFPDQLQFKDNDDDVYFKLHETVPGIIRTAFVPPKPGQKKNQKIRINLKLLIMYGIYRNAFIDSYRTKADLAQDIKVRPMEFEPDAAFNKIVSIYSEDEKHLYQYAHAIALRTMKDWNTPSENMKAFLAYTNIDGKEQEVGFVHFTEKIVQGRAVVYIAEAGVSKRNASIGRRLMECVISYYPPKTEFQILARAFNSNAIVLYRDRLGFDPINPEEIELLGYSKDRYVGFTHISTDEKIRTIKNKQQAKTARPGLQ